MAASETSIATAKKLDIDTLMSSNFDFDNYFGPDKAAQMDSLTPYVDKEELKSKVNMTAFLQDIGVTGNDNLSAHTTAAQVVLNQPTYRGLWGSVKEGYQNNEAQIAIANIRLAERQRQISPAQAQEQVDAIKSTMKETKAKGFASFAKAAAGQIPMITETTGTGAKYGLAAGGAAAGMAALAGQAGPQIAAPEEIVTVPGAFMAVGVPAMGYGTWKRATELEAGLMYDELLSMKDENGNKIDPELAGHIADTVGAINGLLEVVQIKDIVKTIPGGKKLLAKAQRDTIKSLLQNKSVMKILAKGTVRYAGHVGFETATEVAQEADNVILGEFAKNINNRLAGTNIPAAKQAEISSRLIETAAESAKAFSLIAAPGNVLHIAGETIDTVEKPTEKGVVEPVSRISRIMPAEKIIPRLDIEQLGKTFADVGMPEKQPRAAKVKEPPVLTPEEEYQLQQTEATFKAEEGFAIKPKLYIGNVTKRMKELFADITGMEPEDVRGFTEGAFPTKRTGVEMTMGEARTLLTVMEESLQDRLDNNQIRTHPDMARANADWGDIKELRHKLGLPKADRPFKVIPDQKTDVITIENVKERIGKAVQPSKAAKIDITHLDRLNSVMRRVAKSTKEGYKLGKAEQKQLYAELQYLRKQKDMRDKLVKKITAEPSDKIDFFYREAIKGLQNAIDWKIKTEGKKAEKESLKKLLSDNPDKAGEIPQNLLDTLSKKDVEALSLTDLYALNNEIKRLKQIGALKSELYRKQRIKALTDETSAAVKSINNAPKNIFPSIERANTLRPTRLFDMLDGGKKFAGNIFNFFYRQTNEDFNAEMQNTDQRQSVMKMKLAELGLTIKDFAQKRMVGDVKFKLDELLKVYAAWKNPESQATLKYGGLIIDSQKDPVIIDDARFKQISDSLNEKEKLWADTIIAEYAEHKDRSRNAVIRAENRDMGNVVNYTPIRRVGVVVDTSEQEILDELALRHFFRKDGPHKNFTIPRKDIPAEFQKPMKNGLTQEWFQEVRKQEHYINNAMHIKDMQAMVNKEEFRNAVTDKFGDPVYSSVKHFVSMIANPDFYKTFSDIEQISKIARRHAAIAYIGFNLSSILNQFPSMMMYWAHSSVGDIIKSTADAAFHPMASYENAVRMHPQLAHITIEREMEELKRVDSNAYKRIIDKIGRAGMFGLVAIDRSVRVIGINAVYNKSIRDGLSPSEAAHKAAMVTLLTQEAAGPKDIAQLYSSNEVLNWFTMFTNQLNQLYNVTTYDIPMAWRNKNYMEAARSAFALSTMAMMIWAIQSGELPDEPEDAAVALGEQFVSSIPLVGSSMVSAAKGWEFPPMMFAGPTALVKGIKSGYKGDMEKALSQLSEGVSVVTGFPYQGVRDAYSVVEEGGLPEWNK